MTGKIQNFGNQASEWLWQRRFDRLYSPHTGLRGDPARLRLVLGLAGSGLDWLAGLLSGSAPRVRFYNEPLKRITPPLTLSGGADRCASHFSKALPAEHSLLRVLRMLVEPDNVWANERMSNRLPHATYDPWICLVKESRALLASEALVKGLGARTLFVVSEPVRVVDGIFAQGGLENPYLAYEEQATLTPAFLSRFLPRDREDALASARIIGRLPRSRERSVLGRALTAGLINRMLLMLAARSPTATAVSIHRLARAPSATLRLLIEMLGNDWRETAELQVADAAANLPGVGPGESRLHVPALWEPLRFLSAREAVACRDMLAECGLAGGDTDELISDVVGVSVFPPRRHSTHPTGSLPAASPA